jgi:hypothetical protein
VQFDYSPQIRAQIALGRNNPTNSVELLRAAEPYELGQNSVLHPAYVRGQAYLAGRQGSEASIEFQKILDHPGVVVNDAIGALAHLQLGRAYAMQATPPKPRRLIRIFLHSGKTPILTFQSSSRQRRNTRTCDNQIVRTIPR